MRAALAALGLGLLAMAGAGPGAAEPTRRILPFEALQGWAQDDHAAALSAFLETCDLPRGSDWPALCGLARQAARQGGARAFFELLFRPVLIGGEAPALFTGYFEPELDGARRPSGRFRVPLYRRPPELAGAGPWFTRAEIERRRLLEGRGLEIAWLEDPVEAFFLQIQGSGRIRLPDGGVIRVGYGGHNGHPYRSVGAEMIARGLIAPHQASAETIRDFVRRHPAAGAELLRSNPAFVFFREVTGVPPEKGPVGAMGRSLTALRSLAVDPRHVVLGAPVWIETAGADPMRRLLVAQDTGSAIKGAQRGDIFFGTGAAAGRRAGVVKDAGRMVVLLPVALADALARED